MATVLLAAGNSALSSASFALAVGESTTLTPVGSVATPASMADTAWAYLEKQTAGAVWKVEGSAFTLPGVPRVLEAAGTYRINRPAQVNNIGIDRD